MRVRLLGTGASDGWPDPWCSCASCRSAADQGVLRGQTGVLVDDRLLLDLGPELPRAALRQGVSLAGIDAILVTHAHEDHLAAASLMWRSWLPDARPLELVGPPAVLALAGDRGGSAVRTRALRPGERVQVAGYDVLALPARHGGEELGPAVLYDVSSPAGTRLLYATDTGVLPEAAVRLATGRAYDLVLLELTSSGHDTHLDLATWPAQVERLRTCGAVTASTRVVAIHLGHGNPPPDVLDRLLTGWGATAGRDGQLIDLHRPAGRRVLVLGGARSGKSAFAEALLSGESAVMYVATAPPRSNDPEWDERVRRHAARRPSTWRTVETGDVAAMLRFGPGGIGTAGTQAAAGTVSAPRATGGPGAVLVDDLGLWLTRVIDAADGWRTPGPSVDAAMAELGAAWRQATGTVVMVCPEVGAGVVPEHRSGRIFRDLLGELAAGLAKDADEVVQVVAGIPRRLA